MQVLIFAKHISPNSFSRRRKILCFLGIDELGGESKQSEWLEMRTVNGDDVLTEGVEPSRETNPSYTT